MRNSWVDEGWRFLLVLLAGLMLGMVSDHLAAVLVVALLAYSAYNLANLRRLVRWLSNPEAQVALPNGGVWGDIRARVQRIINAHQQRERQLTGMLEEFQASASALPDAAVALGSHSEIRWCNDAAQKLLKLRYPQDLGQPLVNLFRAPQLAGYLENGDFSTPLEITAPGDKTRTLSVRVTGYGEGEQLLLAQDISDRVMAEQIRKDFVANVSHELRTPLTVISGFVENMQMDEQHVPAQWRRPVGLIAEQAERMRHIVEDLLLLARLESASVEAPREGINVPELLQAIVQDGRSLAGEALRIEANIDSRAWLAGNPGQVRSAFTNLLVNAIHHTPPGGQVTLGWQESGDGCVFSVKDSGEGIAAEHIPRLTERFYRVDVGRSRERGGTGLGLAIVKHVLQKHGARLHITSTLGQGSIFSCRFPADRCLQAAE